MSSSMRVAAITSGLIACAFGWPLHAQAPASTQWIVTAANGRGAAGDWYGSSLVLFNPNAIDAPVEVSFLPQSALDDEERARGDNSGARAEIVVVPAGRARAFGGFWPELAGSGIAGGIRVVSTATDAQGRPLPIEAHSVTRGSRVEPQRETLCAFIPGQGPEQLVTSSEPARVPALLTGPSTWTAYRSNLFLLSTNEEAETVVELTLVDTAGESRGTRVVTLAPLAQTQINDVGGYFGYQLCAKGCPSVVVPEGIEVLVSVRSGGPVAAGGVVIERENGSGIYAPAFRLRAP